MGDNSGVDGAVFRVYRTADKGVRDHYAQMRSHQCVAFADRLESEGVFSFNHLHMTVREAFTALESFVDRSDPDLELPNMVHALQTAERARAAGEPEWLVVTALIHDLGKMMYKFGREADGMSGRADGPQFSLGGDTWVLGCAIPPTALFPELSKLNPDVTDPVYGTELGCYKEGQGIMNLRFVIGHDEYMYRWLLFNKVPLADVPEALQCVRLHSCYPWHAGGAYRRLMAPGDDKVLATVKNFNQYDLYSKSNVEKPDAESLWPFYQTLVDKYLGPGKFWW